MLLGTATPGCREPDWLLDDGHLPDGLAQRSELRLDILIVTPAEQGMPADGPRKVTLVEVGCCSDTRSERLAEKQQKHQALKQVLVARELNVTVAPIMSGSMGSVFKSIKRPIMTLGASRTESQLLLVKLFMHVVRNLHNSVMTRRQLVHRSRQARLRPEAPKRARGQCPTLTKFGLPCRLAS